MRVPVAVSQLCELLYTSYLLLPLTYPCLDLGETFWRTFNISRYLSVCLSICPFFVGATGHSFGAILTLSGSHDVISQPLVPFGGYVNIAPPPIKGVKSPKKHNFGALIGVFKPNAQNIKTFILSKVLQRFQPNLA